MARMITLVDKDESVGEDSDPRNVHRGVVPTISGTLANFSARSVWFTKKLFVVLETSGENVYRNEDNNTVRPYNIHLARLSFG